MRTRSFSSGRVCEDGLLSAAMVHHLVLAVDDVVVRDFMAYLLSPFFCPSLCHLLCLFTQSMWYSLDIVG